MGAYPNEVMTVVSRLLYSVPCEVSPCEYLLNGKPIPHICITGHDSLQVMPAVHKTFGVHVRATEPWQQSNICDVCEKKSN